MVDNTGLNQLVRNYLQDMKDESDKHKIAQAVEMVGQKIGFLIKDETLVREVYTALLDVQSRRETPYKQGSTGENRLRAALPDAIKVFADRLRHTSVEGYIYGLEYDIFGMSLNDFLSIFSGLNERDMIRDVLKCLYKHGMKWEDHHLVESTLPLGKAIAFTTAKVFYTDPSLLQITRKLLNRIVATRNPNIELSHKLNAEKAISDLKQKNKDRLDEIALSKDQREKDRQEMFKSGVWRAGRGNNDLNRGATTIQSMKDDLP